MAQRFADTKLALAGLDGRRGFDDISSTFFHKLAAAAIIQRSHAPGRLI
jgi:hypothetical protein